MGSRSRSGCRAGTGATRPDRSSRCAPCSSDSASACPSPRRSAPSRRRRRRSRRSSPPSRRRRARPSMRLSRRSMLAISRSIEDACAASGGPSVLVGSFQREAVFRRRRAAVARSRPRRERCASCSPTSPRCAPPTASSKCRSMTHRRCTASGPSPWPGPVCAPASPGGSCSPATPDVRGDLDRRARRRRRRAAAGARRGPPPGTGSGPRHRPPCGAPGHAAAGAPPDGPHRRPTGRAGACGSPISRRRLTQPDHSPLWNGAARPAPR